ncbi:UxaA family hydrolase [uncultured Sphaerochaeta sp.]|uniref:UxaA family hydrolase n=1 Tax=uncultured Sphaerochaeta sp. TaxID=886478 RepID=UPI002A0A9A5A|nr:UxaA family hydrolase [uncultured Sphaerochaeta sp.]
MEEKQSAFQIQVHDSVATVLCPVIPGPVLLYGEAQEKSIEAIESIPIGHKIALKDIVEGEDILKYGIVIGRASIAIPKGAWVHLHCMHSLYDERSSHLDSITGAPKDTKYE